MSKFKILIIQGDEFCQYIPQLAALRIEIFREYPYLYDGTMAYEEKYLKTYSSSQNAMAVLIFYGDSLVGASTGVLLADETAEFKKPFVELGLNPEKIFYCGESVLKKEYRGSGLYKDFFRYREQFAKGLPGVDKICFCGVVRQEGHPLQPKDYQPLDKIWQHFGYELLPGVIAHFTWKDIDQVEQTSHPMQFWLKYL